MAVTDGVPEGWGLYGIGGDFYHAEVWLIRLPIPKNMPSDWPIEDTGVSVLGNGKSVKEAIRDASVKIGKL